MLGRSLLAALVVLPGDQTGQVIAVGAVGSKITLVEQPFDPAA